MLGTFDARVTNDVAPTLSFPAPFGLFSVVQTPSPSDSHWVNGIEWEHSSCAAVTGISGQCDDEAPLGIGEDGRFLNRGNVLAQAHPFTLYGSHVCSAPGSSFDLSRTYARENLERHEQEGVEDAIWSGDLNTTPVLATATTVDLTPTPGTAISPRHALGLLSQHAAETFGVSGAVIHAPRLTMGVLTADCLTVRVGDRMETALGDLVSFGAGYPNTSPAGADADPGEAWLYVTPPVIMLASDVRILPGDVSAAINTANNDLLTIAERTYVVGWDDCPLGAVLVDLT
jgi:hypothetical protein